MAIKKLTAAQAIAFLKMVGLDAELVAEEKDSDMVAKADDADFVPLTNDDLILLIDESRKPIIEAKVKTELNAVTHKDVTAKVYGGLRKQLIEEGIPAAEIEGKTEKEMAKIARAHFSKNSNMDAEAINLKMAEMAEAHQNAMNEKETTWKTKYGELENSLNRTQIMDIVKSMYKDAKGINPKANVDILAEDFLSNLEKGANVKLSADRKSIELYDKADNSRIMNATKTNFADAKEQLKAFHEPRGQWNEDNRQLSAKEEMDKRNNTQVNQIKPNGETLSQREARIENINNWLSEEAPAA